VTPLAGPQLGTQLRSQGELAAATDLATEQLADPAYYRVLVTGRPVALVRRRHR
jgi:hypothetical protein